MGNPLPRSQSLTRQKWNSGQQKWDSGSSALSSSTRPSTRASGGAMYGRQLSSVERLGSSGELNSSGRPARIFYSGEIARTGAGRLPSPTPLYVSAASSNSNLPIPRSTTATRDAATNTDEPPDSSAGREAFSSGRMRSSVRVRREDPTYNVGTKEVLKQDDQCSLELSSSEAKCNSDSRTGSSNDGATTGSNSVTTSAQTEKEGSHSRLLSRGGESSSFRGRQLSSSSRRESSSSFRRETVSSSFRKEAGVGPRRIERKATKSFQDGDMSSIASESARGSPCSIHYSEAPFAKNCQTPQNGVPWTSSPSSPDTGFGKSSVPFHWEEAPGKAKTIAAAAEMALARKLVRDESLRRLTAGSPRSSIDSHGSFRIEKKSSPVVSRRISTDQHLQPQLSSSNSALPLPPSKKFSQELTHPRKESHSSQLIEDLKAAVVRKQAEAKSEVDDDNRSVISDYCAGDTQIDLVAPAAAKFLNREDDVPTTVTPVKTPLAAVPFKWEEAPGKPKESISSPTRADPPSLSLPPRLLGGCHNPSKEQKEKILQTYSCNLLDMHWSSSGNPTPLSRSRDSTPSRRERTPTRRDRTPTKRDLTPARREVTPTRRDSTPTRSYFPTRVVPKSGPIPFPAVAAVECVREHHSGPLRSNTHPNYLNVPPRNVSQEFARVTQESALTVLTEDLERSNRTVTSDAGSLQLHSYISSRKVSQELQIVRYDSTFDASSSRGTENSSLDQSGDSSSQECRALVKVTPLSGGAVDPLSPTSILCGPDLSSQRTASNLSTAYAESSHSHHQDVISGGHTKTESLTSLESFVDETYTMPPPWSGSETVDSPYRDLGPIDLQPVESTPGHHSMEQGLKAIVRFCRRAKKWNKSKTVVRKNSAEPDMWAPTLATYFQKIELGSNILSKVGSQVFPETKESKTIHHSGILSVPCSPLKYIPRSGELTMTPDRLGARKPIGSMTPVHVITTCRSPSYRVMATDECFSVISIGKMWNGTKARHAKWGRKMRRSSRLMGAIFAALKRSMLMKCGRQGLPTIPSDKNLLDRDGEVISKEFSQSQRDAVHSLSADHQFHRPL
ncbi:unnamed protein product [Calypogeia fissa]